MDAEPGRLTMLWGCAPRPPRAPGAVDDQPPRHGLHTGPQGVPGINGGQSDISNSD